MQQTPRIPLFRTCSDYLMAWIGRRPADLLASAAPTRMNTLARPRDKAEILGRLRGLRPESVGRWGRMSAHQMVCHLADSFRAVIGRTDVSPATGCLQRTVVKWVALYLPLPWPRGIATRPEIDQCLGGTKPADFAADVAELEALVEFVTAPASRVEWHAHPIFGQMSEAAWLRWGYLHMDHHLRQFGMQGQAVVSGLNDGK